MLDLEIIDDPATAVVALDPIRARLLAALAEPASATTLGAKVGLSRQKVNYHLRALESHGLVRLHEERHWGGLTERILVASASAYVISPSALGEAATDPVRMADRLSARYLIAVAARVVREVGSLAQRADAQGKRLATLAIDAEIRFRSAADRTAFADELSAAVAELVGRYHDESARGGRRHRLVIGAHAIPDAARSGSNEVPPGDLASRPESPGR